MIYTTMAIRPIYREVHKLYCKNIFYCILLILHHLISNVKWYSTILSHIMQSLKLTIVIPYSILLHYKRLYYIKLYYIEQNHIVSKLIGIYCIIFKKWIKSYYISSYHTKSCYIVSYHIYSIRSYYVVSWDITLY